MSKCHFVKVYFIGLLFCFLSAVVLFYTYTELQHGLHSDVLHIFQPVPFFYWSFYILRQESITLEKNMLLLNLKF